jgi:tripartite-type tricarboxylate transporter receptor subunit TctC
MNYTILTLVTCLVALTGFATPAAAQDYPAKPVRIVVPFAPGGASDILGRLVAERLGEHYKQSFIVENKPGASGHIGAQQVAKAAGDGYTLMIGTIGIHAAYASYTKLGYDPARELQPIMVLGESPNIVVVPAASPYKTFGDFLADARANPGKINYASAGPGSSIHMVTALFENMSGARLTHVPYKGSGPALVDLIGGQIQVMFENFSSGMPHVKSGKLRVLAVTTGSRERRIPDVPTVAEAGVPGYAGSSWFTFAAPRSVPGSIVEKLNRDLQAQLQAPEAQAKLETLGINFTPNTPAQAEAYFKSETVKWNAVIKAANLKLD